jgi:hypothetical protein
MEDNKYIEIFGQETPYKYNCISVVLTKDCECKDFDGYYNNNCPDCYGTGITFTYEGKKLKDFIKLVLKKLSEEN